MESVQELLAQLTATGWTKSAIARELGVGYVAVYRWSTGSQRPANIRGTVMQLEELIRRRRIPKQKEYTKKPPPALEG